VVVAELELDMPPRMNKGIWPEDLLRIWQILFILMNDQIEHQVFFLPNRLVLRMTTLVEWARIKDALDTGLSALDYGAFAQPAPPLMGSTPLPPPVAPANGATTRTGTIPPALEGLLSALVEGIKLSAEAANKASALADAASKSAAVAVERCEVAVLTTERAVLAAPHKPDPHSSADGVAWDSIADPPPGVDSMAPRSEALGDVAGSIAQLTPGTTCLATAGLAAADTKLPAAPLSRSGPGQEPHAGMAELSPAPSLSPVASSMSAAKSPSPLGMLDSPHAPSKLLTAQGGLTLEEASQLIESAEAIDSAEAIEKAEAIGRGMCQDLDRAVSDSDAATAATYYQYGVHANRAEDFVAASSWFEASHRLCA
jgi:hypothetical protein